MGTDVGTKLDRIQETGRVYSESEEARILEAKIVEAPERPAIAFGLDPGGGQLVQRTRVRLRGGLPVSLSTTWFDAAIADDAPRLLKPERIEESTFVYVAEAMGVEIANWVVQYEPGSAGRDVATELRVRFTAPIIVSYTWIYADDDRLIEYGESKTTELVTHAGAV